MGLKGDGIETELNVTAGRPTPGDVWVLRIEDDRSGTRVAELEFDPLQFLGLMTNSGRIRIPATLYVSEGLGRYAEFESEESERDWSDRRDDLPLGDPLVDDAFRRLRARKGDRPEWMYLHASRNNRGQWRMRFVRYHDTKPADWDRWR